MFSLTKPCVDCPFLRSRKFPLRRARVAELLAALTKRDQTFSCHKTVTHDDDGEPLRSASELHCAGALILLEKLNRPNQMMRISERIGSYDRGKLDMAADVFDTPAEMLRAKHWLR